MTQHHDQIPNWNESGVLPAVDPDDSIALRRSPYVVSLIDLVVRLGFTDARRRLISGLLEYRNELHRLGVIAGFQWVNGSFTEYIEESGDRSPNDVDLVTFLHIPTGQTIRSLAESNPNLFTPAVVKANYKTDAYFVTLNPDAPQDIVKQTVYWYSLWSHTREGLWKGFLQIDLAPTEDELAKSVLDRLISEGGEP